MNIANIINSGISNNEKISLIEEHITELEQIIMCYKLRDSELIKKIRKPVKRTDVLIVGGDK